MKQVYVSCTLKIKIKCLLSLLIVLKILKLNTQVHDFDQNTRQTANKPHIDELYRVNKILIDQLFKQSVQRPNTTQAAQAVSLLFELSDL